MMNSEHLVLETDGVRHVPELPLTIPLKTTRLNRLKPLILLITLLLLWFIIPGWLLKIDETAGSVDQGIWLLVLLSLICFLLVINLSWWLFKHAWLGLGLPSIHKMVSQFNILSPWQQLHFFLASFALVLIAALSTMIAIC